MKKPPPSLMVYALSAVPLAFLGLRYLYCLGSDGAGTLLGGGAPTLRLPFTDFARRFLKIWVKVEDGLGNPQWGFGNC
ncbi:MAG: hypothetical protein WBM81_05015 [Sedimenticolaceae bacterium]